MNNPETFMGNIEQEWTIQRHSWATLSKNGQSRDIHGQHCARIDNPETFMGNIGHKTENENKKKYTAQKTKKMSNTDSNKIPGVNTVLVQEG